MRSSFSELGSGMGSMSQSMSQQAPTQSQGLQSQSLQSQTQPPPQKRIVQLKDFEVTPAQKAAVLRAVAEGGSNNIAAENVDEDGFSAVEWLNKKIATFPQEGNLNLLSTSLQLLCQDEGDAVEIMTNSMVRVYGRDI
jgi:hypothetical protein